MVTIALQRRRNSMT